MNWRQQGENGEKSYRDERSLSDLRLAWRETGDRGDEDEPLLSLPDDELAEEERDSREKQITDRQTESSVSYLIGDLI